MVTSPWLWTAAVAGILVLVRLFTMKTENAVILKVKTMVLNLWNGFSSITKMEGKWWFLLYTLLVWGCYYLQLYIATFAFSFTAPLGVVPVLVLFVLSSIGMGVPTNGGLGSWHIAIIFGLSLYGVGVFDTQSFDSNASAFAMLVWGVQTLLLIVLGLYAYVSMTIDRSRIRSGKTVVRASGDGMQL